MKSEGVEVKTGTREKLTPTIKEFGSVGVRVGEGEGAKEDLRNLLMKLR